MLRAVDPVLPGDQTQLPAVYGVVRDMFSNADSPIYKGVVTSRLSSGGVQVTDPSGIDSLQQPSTKTDPFTGLAVSGPGETTESSSSELSAGAIAGIVIGSVSGATLLAGIVFWAAHAYKNRKDEQNLNISNLQVEHIGGRDLQTPAPTQAPYNEAQTAHPSNVRAIADSFSLAPPVIHEQPDDSPQRQA